MRPPRRPPRPAALPALCAFASACNPEPKGGFSPEFECGELDYFEVVALTKYNRTYEIACGQPLDGDNNEDLTWRELAVELERSSAEGRGCDGPDRNRTWYSLREGCAIEAALNALIHGLQTVGCPAVRDVGGWPEDTFYAASSYIDGTLRATMRAECPSHASRAVVDARPGQPLRFAFRRDWGPGDTHPDDVRGSGAGSGVSPRSMDWNAARPAATSAPPGGSTTHRPAPEQPAYPFACGEVDFYELAALSAGAPFEARCSDVAIGTWLDVAAYLRENAAVDAADAALDDPALACTLASCANILVDTAARSTCDDFSPYIAGRFAAECDAAWRAWEELD
jgi:hypothetical protein